MKRIFRSKRRQTKRGKKNKKSEEKDTSAFYFTSFVLACDSSFFSSACRDEENENENENENDDDDESSSGGVILCQY